MCSLHAYKLLNYFADTCHVCMCVYMSVHTLEDAYWLALAVCVHLFAHPCPFALALPAPRIVHVNVSRVGLSKPTEEYCGNQKYVQFIIRIA